MPFLQQDKGRDGGGSKENRRSWAGNFYNYDFPQSSGPLTAPMDEQHSNEGGSGSAGGQRDWRWSDWEAPASPEAARSPLSLVPAACFPPQHSTAFASYSESARPGEWANEVPGEVTDLAASLKTLTMAPTSAGGATLACSQQYVQERHPYESIDKNVEPPWPPEQLPSTPLNSLPNVGIISRGKEDVLRWSGTLPPRGADSRSGYSPKVFLGGLPWDITEEALMLVLKNFHPVRVEWPGREGQVSGSGSAGSGAECSPRGYAYVTFENEWRVRTLLSAARCDGTNWFYRISSRSMRSKEVQVIPWAVSDSNWVSGGSARLEPSRTVFVGALHGMLSAYALALIMNDLFSGVVYAGIDTDKNKYPIGSGRVTFNNVHSYVRAVSAAYVEISTDKFTKTVQVDPYLEDSMCSSCNLQQGPYFCRDPLCFRYYCRSCWARQHHGVNHKQLMRNSKASYNGASGSQFIAPAPVSTSVPAPALASAHTPSPSPAHASEHRPAVSSTPEPTNLAGLASTSVGVSQVHGAAPLPYILPMPHQPIPPPHMRAVSDQSYHNGYKRTVEGSPSLSPSGSSDLEVANASEQINQRSV